MKFFERPKFRVAVALVTGAFAVCSAWAQAPSRVARLSDFAGDVQLANERDGWHSISRNFPITAGDNVFVSGGGRAELDVGSTQAWIAGGSTVYFDQFDDQHIAARLNEGAMVVRIRSFDAGDSMRVTTPYGEIAFTQPGFYVVNVVGQNSYEAQSAPPSLKVRRGEAEFFAVNRAPVLVRPGQLLTLDRSELLDSRAFRTQSLSAFEAWATSRDGRIGRYEQRNAGVVNPLMIGARDLADYGSWADSYEYGQVWYPTSVAADWAPYRYGRWSWVQPWGWTWVDDAAWGFAPFHYGRWVRVGNRWAWSPGQSVARPIYAPALVTFFGGDQWSYGSAGPTFSWVPLGWNEPYAPWYTYTPTYWREVNRPHIRHDTRPDSRFDRGSDEPWRPQHFTHASVRGAITAVASTAFISGRPVAQNYLRNVNERDLRSAPPARMGEVLPQPSRLVPPTLPRAGEPARFPAAPVIRDRVRAEAPHITPNTNVMQPRVMQDPNPVVGRRVEPVAPNTRITAPVTPMPKPRDERMQPPSMNQPRVQPMQAPQPGFRSPAPQPQSQQYNAPQAAPVRGPVSVPTSVAPTTQMAVPGRPAAQPVPPAQSNAPRQPQPALRAPVQPSAAPSTTGGVALPAAQPPAVVGAAPVIEAPQREKGRAPAQPVPVLPQQQ